jgi:cbb3-type cytochrome oxidase maturation protein
MNVLTMWLLYALFGTSVFAAAFFWAVRARQFRDSDRARHLPLTADERWLPDAGSAARPRWLALVIPAAAMLATYAALVVAVWILLSRGGR